MIRLTRQGTNEVEDIPKTTDTHATATATVAFVQFFGCPEAKSSHRPFPPLEAPRIVRPMAPTNEKTNRMKNPIRLGR